MQDLSIATFWLALVATAAAVLFYWGYAFGARVVLRRLAAAGDGGFTVATFERLPESFGRLGTLAAWTAAAFLGASLVSRVVASGRPPYTNLWEFTVAFAGGVMLFHIIFERWYGQRTLGSFILPVVLGLMVVSAVFFPSKVEPLVPALQANRILALHVGMMIMAYSALSISFGAALVYLVQGGNRQRFPRLPAARLLDEIAYRSVIVGFPLLTLGIALGAYWGNSAWGRYWGWDPKETSALMTWLIYAGYLHMRGLRGWTGGRSAALLVVGFAAILFTYFAVNFWVSGLHSYAGV